MSESIHYSPQGYFNTLLFYILGVISWTYHLAYWSAFQLATRSKWDVLTYVLIKSKNCSFKYSVIIYHYDILFIGSEGQSSILGCFFTFTNICW